MLNCNWSLKSSEVQMLRMSLVLKFLRSVFLEPCTTVEGLHSHRQHEFSHLHTLLPSGKGSSLWRPFIDTSLLLLFSPYRWVFSEPDSTDEGWWSFLPPHVHSTTPRYTLVSGPSPLEVSCFSRMKALLPSRCFRSMTVLNTELLWAQDYLPVPAVGPQWPSRPSLLLLCKPAVLTEALDVPTFPPSQLTTSAFLRDEEYGQTPAMTYLSPSPASLVPADLPLLTIHCSSPGCPCRRSHAAPSCPFLEITASFPFDARTSSSASSDHHCKSHHDLYIHSVESRHEGTQ